jgi:hypothetical protein
MAEIEQNFEKTSNARVIQLTGKLTSMKLGEKQSIAEYLEDFREIKVDLEAAGQTVSDLQLAVHALRGLPKEYNTLREILEEGEMELSLDTVQPKLMQRKQMIKLKQRVRPHMRKFRKRGKRRPLWQSRDTEGAQEQAKEARGSSKSTRTRGLVTGVPRPATLSGTADFAMQTVRTATEGDTQERCADNQQKEASGRLMQRETQT